MPGRREREEKQQSPDASAEPLTLGLGGAADGFRLTVCFIALVIVTFLAVEGWRAWRDYRQAFSVAHDSASNLARATAQHAEDAVRQVDLLTAALGERVEGDGIANINVPRIHALMIQQARIMPQLHGLFIYGPDGHWIVTDKPVNPEAANNADRDYFIYHRTHKDQNVRIGKVVNSRSTGEPIIPISRRLDNPDGSFAGVLLGTIKVSYFVDYYGDFKIDDKGALVLTMRDGTILVRRPYNAAVIGQSLAESEIFKTYLPHSDQGVAEVKAVIDGTYRLYGYRALSSYPLVVEAGLSRESFVGPWRRDLIKTGIVLLVLVTGLAVFGFVVLGHLRQRTVMEREIRRVHQTVRNMALTDSLTGLGNRRMLDLVLAKEISRARREGKGLALIMLDVDYFKRFNDKYGHSAGDDCLRQVAEAIRRSLKRPADLAVRYGGEEFTVLLPDTDSNGAYRVAQRILDSIRLLEIEHSDHPLGSVTASGGVATLLPGSEDATADGLIKAADAFLYAAKSKGRNRWVAADCDSLEEPVLDSRSD
ncbi:sensor domain-containing diguanylate cyclase [Pseudomonas sp. DSP3-2-2]|uniref:sensor domain-containing diguanylate cyclase n=1 Tax=unclassified Pseudomonas TaxID=196821 RepID=UPI003CED1889